MEDFNKRLTDLINEFTRFATELFGRFLDLGGILVGSGQKRGLMTTHSLVAGGDIAHQGGEQRSDMGNGVHIVNRSGDDVTLTHSEAQGYLKALWYGQKYRF